MHCSVQWSWRCHSLVLYLFSDFKSIELRLLAHLSADPTLVGVVSGGEDTADDVFVVLSSEW